MEVHLTPTVVIAALACFIAALAFGFTVAAAIGGLVVKAVRLQTKADGHTVELNELCAEHVELKKSFFGHVDKKEIHFDKAVADLVEKRRDDQIIQMKTDIVEIKGMVKELKDRK